MDEDKTKKSIREVMAETKEKYKKKEEKQESKPRTEELNQIDENSDKLISLKIDDHIIANETKENRIYLAILIDDENRCLVRFPGYGKHDEYTAKVIELFSLLSFGAENLNIPENIEALEKLTKNEIDRLANLLAIAFKPKITRNTIEDILFNYLNPIFVGPSFDSYYDDFIKNNEMERSKILEYNSKRINKILRRSKELPRETAKSILENAKKEYARENLSVVFLVDVFLIFLVIDDFYKKKIQGRLKQVYRRETLLPFFRISQKNSE